MPRKSPSPESSWFKGFLQHTFAHVAAVVIVAILSAAAGAFVVAYKASANPVRFCSPADVPSYDRPNVMWVDRNR